MLDSIFIQVSILLAITASIAFVMRLLRQPLMVAYIVAGILSGPLFLNLLHGDDEVYKALSQFGVVLLLFVVGLSLNFDHIKKIGKVSVIVSLTQVLCASAFGYGLLRMLGYASSSALYLGIAITFSSTIIIVKLLSDKKDTEKTYGRYLLGLMVMQDLIAILIMMVITMLGEGQGGSTASLLSVFAAKASLLLVVVYFLSRYLLPKILDKVAISGEFLFIFTVAWCFGVASALYLAGFSLEIGAIIAGLTLGSSPYQPEISSRIKPLRDFFIVLFFIILGSEMAIDNLKSVLLPAIILSVFVLIGSPFILYRSFRGQKFTRRNSFLAAVTAAQVSEFGFVLLFTGIQAGHIQGVELEIFTLVALITIMVSSYLITYNEQLYQKLIPVFNFFGKDRHVQREEEAQKFDVWVFGYHRMGTKVSHALQEKGVSFAVVDFNPSVVTKLKQSGIQCYFGDAADVEFLASLPLEKSRLIISTVPALDDQAALIRHIRSRSEKPKIIANLTQADHLEEMYSVGADYVMMPHHLGGNWMAHLLKTQPWTAKTFSTLKKKQHEEIKHHGHLFS